MSLTAALDTVLSTDVCVYALRDPRDGAVRYIGKAIDPRKRYRQHLQAGQLMRYKSRKNSWIKSLFVLGLQPEIDILDTVPACHADHAECEYIALYRDMEGERLTNGTLGGDGGAMPSAIAKAAGFKRRGIKQADSTRKAMSEAARRRCADPVERARLRSISNGEPPIHLGETNPQAKLTAERVREMRQLHAEGVHGVELARRFGVTPTNVSFIIRRQAWKHV